MCCDYRYIPESYSFDSMPFSKRQKTRPFGVEVALICFKSEKVQLFEFFFCISKSKTTDM